MIDLKDYYTKAKIEWERLLDKAEEDEKDAVQKIINIIDKRLGVINGTTK